MTRSISTMPGGAAEDAVAARLVSDGWTILERRLRIGHLEVDVLAQKKDVVAIVEVRGRRIDGLVSAIDSIDWQKKRHLQKAARTLFSRRFAKDASVRVIRIDVATVTFGPGEPAIEIFEGAIDS
ncbi:MAG: YraN family protein [Polyangiales bacterium]